MLLALRNKQGDLKVNDVLDIDFDMSVVEQKNRFLVRINKTYWDNFDFDSKKEAEDRMVELAEMRNALEEEFRQW